uniref:Uncharacterized protein n=1 Tax=Panagrolaimus sp. JU765 TaxID=591449 RepID=A0AC34QYN1_9BILA
MVNIADSKQYKINGKAVNGKPKLTSDDECKVLRAAGNISMKTKKKVEESDDSSEEEPPKKIAKLTPSKVNKKVEESDDSSEEEPPK